MTLYSSVTILISLLMVAMAIHVLTYSGFNRKQKTWFFVTFFAIAFCAGAEFAVHCGYYDPAFAIPLTIITVLQFSLSPVLAMLFTGALGLKHQWKITAVFFGINFLMQFVCAFPGLIFKFEPSGYERRDLFILYEISYFIGMGYLLIALIFVGRKFRHRDLATILMILAVLIAGIIPMTISKLHVAYAAIGISACLCYIFYNDLVQQDTQADLVANQQRIASMQEHIIVGLASLIESRDTETGEHVARTSALVKMLAEDAVEDGVYTDVIDDHFIDLLATLAPMHDVGKIVVSDKILRKPGKLTPEEYEEMKRHAAEGGTVVRKILSGITDEEYLTFASDIATYHHEKWDGTGYPKGLKGNEIPLSARIMAVADVFDALISKRCYKDAMSFEEAVKTIEEEVGTHFDPALVAVLIKHKEEYRSFCSDAEGEFLPAHAE